MLILLVTLFTQIPLVYWEVKLLSTGFLQAEIRLQLTVKKASRARYQKPFFIVRKEGATYLKQKYTLHNNCLISVRLPIPWFLSMFYSMSRKQTGILPKSFLDRHLSAKAGEKKRDYCIGWSPISVQALGTKQFLWRSLFQTHKRPVKEYLL